MVRLLLFWIIYFVTIASLFGQENNINQSVLAKFSSRDLSEIQTMKDLTRNISELTSNKKEQLQMLLLWIHQNMYVDSIRFIQTGNPLTTGESLKKRIALCDEFTNIVTDFCKTMTIPCIRIDGYVRDLNFKAGDTFEETNHAWNAVYIDTAWVLCDIFWSTNVLKINSVSSRVFVKKINTKYFLATPNTFIVDHLPCDPIFQFNNYPIKITAFTMVEDNIDSTMGRLPYLNYNDSIKVLMKLNDMDRSLRIAQHSYLYNESNPNFLIAEYYNYGVSFVNNKTSSKTELKTAKKYFLSAMTLIDISKKSEIKALKDSCLQGLSTINKRLNLHNK